MQEKITKNSFKILYYKSYLTLVGNFYFTKEDEICLKQFLKELKNPYVNYFGLIQAKENFEIHILGKKDINQKNGFF